jgi:hypothetical protein
LTDPFRRHPSQIGPDPLLWRANTKLASNFDPLRNLKKEIDFYISILHFHSFGLFSFKPKLEQWEKCPLGIWDIANAPKLDGWKYSG